MLELSIKCVPLMQLWKDKKDVLAFAAMSGFLAAKADLFFGESSKRKTKADGPHAKNQPLGDVNRSLPEAVAEQSRGRLRQKDNEKYVARERQARDKGRTTCLILFSFPSVSALMVQMRT